MRNGTLPLRKSTFRRELMKALLTMIILWWSQSLFAQSVGVNTNNPDPSASLEVAGTNKGLLIPRISLQSLTDNATIPNPATALLIYNTNAGLGKAGFYYNSGTPANPTWTGVGAGADLTLPFSKNAFNAGPLFLITNLGNDANGSAITGSGIATIGVRGISQSGRGIVGFTSTTGIGVQASSANISGTALEVNGRMQIHGPGQTIGAGRVLTSDANGYATWQDPLNGNDVFFSANGILGGGSENINPNVLVKIAFANQVYDIGNDYIDASGIPHSTFFAPVKGIFHFDVQVGSSNFQDEDNDNGGVDDPVPYGFSIRLVRTRNGVKDVIAENGNFVTTSADTSISIDVSLEANDRVHVEAIMGSLIPGLLITESQRTFFNGRLVLKQ
ncbi:hypothetical protein [Dyadobacter sp. CY326]|uniref:hypothetical protein n=1 Tax=Dyadobacter sp. CY326 TaxID=2907300 RepID=UPI001F305028|nr:hypothetical protein [Dyadobacter sp. CY326]MCE7065887.1 hypothetical protein [Dyadobacter sp. CY326]